MNGHCKFEEIYLIFFLLPRKEIEIPPHIAHATKWKHNLCFKSFRKLK